MQEFLTAKLKVLTKYLLDTNICIFFFKGQFNLKEKIEAIGLENCYISEITLAELKYGAENSTNPLILVTNNLKHFNRLNTSIV